MGLRFSQDADKFPGRLGIICGEIRVRRALHTRTLVTC